MKKLLLILFLFPTCAIFAQVALTFPDFTIYSSSPLIYSGTSVYSVSAKSIGASTNGLIYSNYDNYGTDYSGVLGLDLNNTPESYPGFNYALYPGADGLYHYVASGSDVAGVASSPGDKYGLRRTGSTVTAEYCRFGTWYVIATFGTTTSAQLYAKAQIYGSYLRNPKIINGTGTGTKYYVKAAGGTGSGLDDTNAWSYAKLISTTLNDYDTVLFKKGDTFTGTTLSVRSNVVYDAYGSGALPIISGLTTLTSWTSLGGGLYEKTLSSPPATMLNLVMFDGVMQDIGRYPKKDLGNDSYFNIDAFSVSSTGGRENNVGTVTSSQIESIPDFVGATFVHKPYIWVIDRGIVTSQTPTVIGYNAELAPDGGNYSYPPQVTHGFFFQNHVNCLTTLGDWCYNTSSHKITMYFGGSTPGAHTIQVPAADTLWRMFNTDNVVIQNITFKGANEHAISLAEVTTTTFKQLDISLVGINGIHTDNKLYGSNTDHNTVDTCYFHSIYNNGVKGKDNSTYWTITKSHFTDIGQIIGMGQTGDDQYIGICKTSSNSLIEYNEVDHIGYLGIRFIGSNCTIRYNYVHAYCTAKVDGSGIYTWQQIGSPNEVGNLVTYNICIAEGWGENYGTGLDDPLNYFAGQVHGIYMDDRSSGVTISNNTSVGNSHSGILVNRDNRNIIVRDNTLYNNAFCQMLYGGSDKTGIVTKNNIFFSVKSGSFTEFYDGTDDYSISQIDIDSNYLCRPIWEPSGINTTGFSTQPPTWWNYTDGGTWGYAGNGWHMLSLDQEQYVYSKDLHSHKTYAPIVDTNQIRFEFNPTRDPLVVSLGATAYRDVTGTPYTTSVTLQPYTSIILISDSTAPANIAPTSNAGSDKTITLPVDSTIVTGSGTDPDGTISTYAWTKFSGPSTYTITSASSATTALHGLIAGTYVFRLTVTDNLGATGSDDVTVLVNPAPTNIPPVSNAGSDKNITLPTDSTIVTGSGTDADGTVTTYAWTKISGPATYTITSASSATTALHGLIQGTYVFRLTVTDNNSATGTDDVTVIVNPVGTTLNGINVHYPVRVR